MYTLFWILTVFVINIVSELLENFINVEWSSIVIGFFALATLIPWLTVNVRRLHDSGKSGSYFFVNFIPIVGRIWYLVLMCTDGEYTINRYGPDPKKPEIDNEIDDIGKPLLED